MRPYLHKVQYYETDGMGIVHHSNYIRWFEEARVDLLEQLGCGYDVFERRGYSSPVLGLSCEYRHMVRFPETVSIHVQVLAYTGAKMTLGYKIYNSVGALCCTGESRHGFLDAASERPVTLKRIWPEAHARFAAALTEKAAE